MTNNNIHPTALIGENVTMGKGNTIGPYCVIGGPRFTASKKEPSGKVIIGNNNVLNSHVVVMPPKSSDATVIGSGCQINSHVFIAHDCQIGDEVIITPGVRLAGYVKVDDWANLGMGSVVHQHRTIGKGAMIGMGAAVIRDVRPLSKVVGVPSREIGRNEVLINRRGL